MHVCTHSERLFLPLPRGRVIDLLEATGEVPKFGDLDLQSMEPPKTTLQAKHQKTTSLIFMSIYDAFTNAFMLVSLITSYR